MKRPATARDALAAAKREAQRAKAESRARIFVAQCASAGLPQPVREHAFALPARRWRFDFAWVDGMVALEVEGGAFAGGAHTRGAHFRSDCEKYNEATRRGWRVLRCLPEQLNRLATVDLVRDVLALASGGG